MLDESDGTFTETDASETKDETVERQDDGYGVYSDAEVSFENDPVSKVMGKELAKEMHLDNVEIETEVTQLEGKKTKKSTAYPVCFRSKAMNG